MRNMDIYHTISGQRDPTAGAALSKLIGEERKAKRQEKKKIKAICTQRKRFSTVRPHKDESGNWTYVSDSDVELCRELVNAAIAAAYQDYVHVLRLLEEIPEPDPMADERVLKKHAKRIEKLKEEMEEIEEFFYSPLYALACDINPDILVNKAWKEAYHDS